MSLRAQVLSELENAAESAVKGLFGFIERERMRARATPCKTHAFHALMYRRLPRWRWIARAHHKYLARRFQALCDVAKLDNPVACAYCDHCANS